MADYAEKLLDRPPGGQSYTPAYPQPGEEPARNYAEYMVVPESQRRRPGELEVPSAKTPASFSALHKAAWVDDPATKIRILAQDRFPDDPNAIERYATKDGKIIFLDTDNQIYTEDLKGVGNLKEFVAEVGGKSLPIAGGVTGGVAGFMSGGAPTGVAGAYMGAASGEGYRKLIANILLDEPQTPQSVARAMTIEGMSGGAGEITGALIGRFLQRGVTRGMSRWEARGGPAERQRLEAQGRDIGVRLYMPQSTNIPSAKARMEWLSTFPETMDQIDDALSAQSLEAYDAANRFIASLTRGKDISIQDVPRAAATAIDQATKNRQRAAAPFYKAAFKRNVVTTPELAELAERPGMQKALEFAKRMAKNEGIDLEKEDNVMLGLHWTQMALRKMDEAMARNPELRMTLGLERNTVQGWRTQILNFLQEKSDLYALARYMYAGGSEELERVTGGMTGDIAKSTQETIETLAPRLFNPKSHSFTEVRNARNAFFRYGQQDKWNRLVQYYLQTAIEEEAGRASGTRGAAVRWSRKILSSPKRKEMMRAALTADQYTKMEKMAEVFSAIDRLGAAGFPGGSRTEPLRRMGEEIGREAAPIASALESPLTMVQRWWQEVSLGQHAEELARMITDPNIPTSRFKDLAKLSPREEKFLHGVIDLFALAPKEADVMDQAAEQVREGPRRPRSEPGMTLSDILGGSPFP